jgi:hypothetical protein
VELLLSVPLVVLSEAGTAALHEVSNLCGQRLAALP